MGNTEASYTKDQAGGVSRFEKVIAVPAERGGSSHISVEIIAVLLGGAADDGDGPQTEGQWLLWLIAAAYLVLVFALPYALYVVLAGL